MVWNHTEHPSPASRGPSQAPGTARVLESQSHHERSVPESIQEHSNRDWSYLLSESDHADNLDDSAQAPSSKQYDSMKDLLSRLKSLEVENYELRNGTAEETSNHVPPPVPHYTWRTFHCIKRDIYLEPPQWKEGEYGPILYASSPMKNISFYIEQHPEIAFVFYKDYDQVPPADNSKIMSKDGIYRIPKPFKQSLRLISEHIISAVEQLEDNIPNFDKFFPDFNPHREIPAPYMFIYHSMPLFDHVVPYLTPLERQLLEQLNESVLASHGEEYIAAKRCAAKGVVSRRLLKYLIQPGDVLVSIERSIPYAYIATTWAKEQNSHEDDIPDSDNEHTLKSKAEKSQAPRKRTYKFDVDVWCWSFDGSFGRESNKIHIQLRVGDEDGEVKIARLNYFPLRFDKDGLHELLKKRGRMFWKCRLKHLVSYKDDDDSVLGSVSSCQKPSNRRARLIIVN